MQFTVIIPTFDRLALVREAVASVLAQSLPADEVIVVDDGSTDGTAAALEDEFGSALRIFQTPNRGVSAARNLGVAQSRGRWLAFLDSDDLWLPGKLAAQAELLASRPDLRICQTEEVWIRNGRRVNPRLRHRKPDGPFFLPSLDLCLVSPSAVVLARDLFDEVGGFDESLPACEDYDLWLRIARIAEIRTLSEPLVVKRGGHADQLSRRYWGMDRFRVQSLRRLLADDGLDATQRQAVGSVLVQKCSILAQGAARRGRLEEARQYEELARAHV